MCDRVAPGSCNGGRDDEVLRRRAVSIGRGQLHLRCSRQPTAGLRHEASVSSGDPASGRRLKSDADYTRLGEGKAALSPHIATLVKLKK